MLLFFRSEKGRSKRLLLPDLLIFVLLVGIVADASVYDQSKRLRTGGDYAHTGYSSPSPFHAPPPPIWGPHGWAFSIWKPESGFSSKLVYLQLSVWCFMAIEKELDLLIAQFAHVGRHFMVVLCVPHPTPNGVGFCWSSSLWFCGYLGIWLHHLLHMILMEVTPFLLYLCLLLLLYQHLAAMCLFR